MTTVNISLKPSVGYWEWKHRYQFLYFCCFVQIMVKFSRHLTFNVLYPLFDLQIFLILTIKWRPRIIKYHKNKTQSSINYLQTQQNQSTSIWLRWRNITSDPSTREWCAPGQGSSVHHVLAIPAATTVFAGEDQWCK